LWVQAQRSTVNSALGYKSFRGILSCDGPQPDAGWALLKAKQHRASPRREFFRRMVARSVEKLPPVRVQARASCSSQTRLKRDSDPMLQRACPFCLRFQAGRERPLVLAPRGRRWRTGRGHHKTEKVHRRRLDAYDRNVVECRCRCIPGGGVRLRIHPSRCRLKSHRARRACCMVRECQSCICGARARFEPSVSNRPEEIVDGLLVPLVG